MKRIILFSTFILFIFLWGQAQESLINNFISVQKGEIPAMLLSSDYLEKAEYINHIQASEFINELKSYSGKHGLDSIVTKEWSEELSSLINAFKYEYKFENDGRDVTMKIFTWNYELEKWKTTFDMYYFFNNDDKLIQSEFEMYVTPIYKTFTKIEYLYANNLLIGESLFTKWTEEELWVEDEQIEYKYNTNNWLTTVITSFWNTSFYTWIVNDKVEYKYDSLGNLTNESRYNWEEYDWEWTEKYRKENSFNVNNNLVQSIDYVPGQVSGTFELDTKVEYAYDTDNNAIREIFYEWEYDLELWLAIEKYEYSKTETDKLFLIKEFAWIENSHSWKNRNKSEFFSTKMLNDQDILYREYMDVYLPVYIFDTQVCELIESYMWIEEGWRKNKITTYHFSPKIDVGFNEIVEAKVSIYPNPVVDFINIEINNSIETDCILRDINGRTISQFTLYQTDKLNISNYQSGIYFVELQQKGQRIFSEKIIKN